MNKQVFSMMLAVLSMLLTNNMLAQKGKITSAQMALQDGKVLDAKKEIDAALLDTSVQRMVKAWNTKGEVYKTIYETKVLYPQNPNCLFDAKDAYIKAYQLETNPKKQKDFSAPLTQLSGYLFNEGFDRFNSKNYEDAYKHFDASRTVNDFLFSKGVLTTIDTNTIYATAMAGLNINKAKEVQPLLEKLVSMNYPNAAVYESLAQIYDQQKNKQALAELLKKGLVAFPGNKNLSIYELNTTLENGDVQQSIDKFEKAAVADPSNASILFNLGVLYDKAHDVEKSKATYEKAIALRSDYSDAYFNLGVIYFNAGVELNKQMNAIDDKQDPAGKKYAELKSQRDELFKKALPNLEKAYSIDPKNADYKANLKKVYASMNMLEKAKALSEQ